MITTNQSSASPKPRKRCWGPFAALKERIQQIDQACADLLDEQRQLAINIKYYEIEVRLLLASAVTEEVPREMATNHGQP